MFCLLFYVICLIDGVKVLIGKFGFSLEDLIRRYKLSWVGSKNLRLFLKYKLEMILVKVIK